MGHFLSDCRVYYYFSLSLFLKVWVDFFYVVFYDIVQILQQVFFLFFVVFQQILNWNKKKKNFLVLFPWSIWVRMCIFIFLLIFCCWVIKFFSSSSLKFIFYFFVNKPSRFFCFKTQVFLLNFNDFRCGLWNLLIFLKLDSD